MSWQKIRSYTRVVALSFEMALRQNVADAFILFTIIVQPLIITILALLMLRDQGENYAIFVVIGSGMTGLWSSMLFISGNSINLERWTGTLESLVGSPTPIQVVVFGKSLANVLQSLFSMLGSYILVSLIFGFPIKILQPGLFIIAVIFTIISFVCFGLIMASLFVVNPDLQRWQNGLEFPIYILCGFLFPIAILPSWTTPLSYLLAPYWAAQALHGSSNGSMTIGDLSLALGMMAFFSFTYLALSGRLFRVMLRKARVDATLGMQ
ncbi:MAG: ABC transporter permease [Chloroflexi bacterium]|nr:ABC transporter permease [Chloroflexota bacterium]